MVVAMYNYNYKKQWIDSDGREYRMDFYNRSGKVVDNPTSDQLIEVLEAYQPSSILEVGCGYGRLLKPVTDHFGMSVAGCDVSSDMLKLCPVELTTFEHDLCLPTKFTDRWDVGYCRGVFMYFTAEQIRTAMEEVAMLVRRHFIVFEWQEVCDLMQGIDSSVFFEFRPILQKVE